MVVMEMVIVVEVTAGTVRLVNLNLLEYLFVCLIFIGECDVYPHQNS